MYSFGKLKKGGERENATSLEQFFFWNIFECKNTHSHTHTRTHTHTHTHIHRDIERKSEEKINEGKNKDVKIKPKI